MIGDIPSIDDADIYVEFDIIASFRNCLASSLMKGDRFLVRRSNDLLRVRLRRLGLYLLLIGERDLLRKRSTLRLRCRSRDRLLRRSCVSVLLLCRSALHLLSALNLRSQLNRLYGLLLLSGDNTRGLLRSQFILGELLLFSGLILKGVLRRTGLKILL